MDSQEVARIVWKRKFCESRELGPFKQSDKNKSREEGNGSLLPSDPMMPSPQGPQKRQRSAYEEGTGCIPEIGIQSSSSHSHNPGMVLSPGPHGMDLVLDGAGDFGSLGAGGRYSVVGPTLPFLPLFGVEEKQMGAATPQGRGINEASASIGFHGLLESHLGQQRGIVPRTQEASQWGPDIQRICKECGDDPQRLHLASTTNHVSLLDVIQYLRQQRTLPHASPDLLLQAASAHHHKYSRNRRFVR